MKADQVLPSRERSQPFESPATHYVGFRTSSLVRSMTIRQSTDRLGSHEELFLCPCSGARSIPSCRLLSALRSCLNERLVALQTSGLSVGGREPAAEPEPVAAERGTESCAAEGEDRGSLTDFAAVAP